MLFKCYHGTWTCWKTSYLVRFQCTVPFTQSFYLATNVTFHCHNVQIRVRHWRFFQPASHFEPAHAPTHTWHPLWNFLQWAAGAINIPSFFALVNNADYLTVQLIISYGQSNTNAHWTPPPRQRQICHLLRNFQSWFSSHHTLTSVYW